jgi:hypothetical protein
MLKTGFHNRQRVGLWKNYWKLLFVVYFVAIASQTCYKPSTDPYLLSWLLVPSFDRLMVIYVAVRIYHTICKTKPEQPEIFTQCDMEVTEVQYYYSIQFATKTEGT